VSIPPHYAVLCGGLGGSRFVDALTQAAGGERVTAIVNVADDLEILGLRVSPDLDTVLYTLAGLLDEERGWGVKDETTNALQLAGRLGGEDWFTLGDRDIGLHLVRTKLLREDVPLSQATRRLCERLGVTTTLLPASDDPVRTFLTTPAGELDFQTWFVGRRHADEVLSLRYEGAEGAAPAPGVREALAAADTVFLAPSNPFVSIQPILAVPGIRGTIEQRTVPCVAVSPLIGGRAVRGPLDRMMLRLVGGTTPAHVASCYPGLVDTLVIDNADAPAAGTDVSLVVTDTLIGDRDAAARLAHTTLEAAVEALT